jgi:RNA polymerase sigma factor (sigma-70 family)
MIQDAAERAWVLQAQAGSTVAYSSLVRTHQHALRAFLRRLCGNWVEADDLAQDTFMAAWTHIRRFRIGASFRSWLFGIGYRKFLSSRRSLFRRHRSDALALDGYPSVDHSASNMGRQVDVHRALHALPPEQRAAVVLCMAAEFSHSEAAEALRLPLGTVKSHIQRGRARLLAILGDDND